MDVDDLCTTRPWKMLRLQYCLILAIFLPKSNIDYTPIIPLQITHQQIAKGPHTFNTIFIIFTSFRQSNNWLLFYLTVLIQLNSSSSTSNDSKTIEPLVNEQKEFNDTVKKERKVMMKSKQTADGYVKLAATLTATGQNEEALNAYKSALKMKPVSIKL